VWLQEEPENMGAWRYIRSHLESVLPNGIGLRYIGRPDQASPAEGHAPDHNREQNRLLKEAFSQNK
jgi:2-oxoglutarate dehydrogenase E1 component